MAVKYRTLRICSVIALMACGWNMPAYASAAGGGGGGGSNCQFSQAFNKTWEAKYQDILKCYMKGIDPPLKWRPGGGTGTVEGTRGSTAAPTNITAWRAPEDPPIGQSASSAAMNFANNFPSFPGWANNGGSGNGNNNSDNADISCDSEQTSGECTCEGVSTVGDYSSHSCTASPAEAGSNSGSAGVCNCTKNTFTGSLAGTGETDKGTGVIAGTISSTITSGNNLKGTFTGVITYDSGETENITATFTGTIDDSGKITGSISGVNSSLLTSSLTPEDIKNDLTLKLAKIALYYLTSTGTNDDLHRVSSPVPENRAMLEPAVYQIPADMDTRTNTPYPPHWLSATSSTGNTTGEKVAGKVSGTISGIATTSTGFCPVEGDRVAMTTQHLSCGGSVPAPALSNRITNLMDNPYALGLIDEGQYWFHYYEKDVIKKRYRQVKSYKLPTFLCRMENVCNASGVCSMQKVKDIDISAPLPQLFSYNTTLNTLYIKLKSSDAYDLEDAFTANTKVLRVPIIAGKPYIPKADENGDGDLSECDLTSNYYVNEPVNTQFLSILPFYEDACSRGEFYLGGSCLSKILTFDKEHPTIVAPEDSVLGFFPVEGRKEVMVSSSKAGMLVMRDQSLVRLGGSGPYFFPEGATVKYFAQAQLDGMSLWIQPPATVNANSNQVTVPNGAWVKSFDGEKTDEYAAGTTVNLKNWGSPLYVTPHGMMELRNTMDYPTYRNSYIRLPISPPPSE